MFQGFHVHDANAFAEAVAVAVRKNKPRPFAGFRGDVRRPVRRRAKPFEAGMARLHAASIVADRASNIAKLQRGLRIIKRLAAAEVAAS